MTEGRRDYLALLPDASHHAGCVNIVAQIRGQALGAALGASGGSIFAKMKRRRDLAVWARRLDYIARFTSLGHTATRHVLLTREGLL